MVRSFTKEYEVVKAVFLKAIAKYTKHDHVEARLPMRPDHAAFDLREKDRRHSIQHPQLPIVLRPSFLLLFQHSSMQST